MTSKAIFFFSEKCMFCKEAYMMITKIGKDNFEFKNVDHEYQLPEQLDRVPCILVDNKLLFEDNLFQYLKSKMDIAPFMINEMGSTFSDKYSYMDNSGTNLDHNYLYLNKEFKINTPSESDTQRIVDYDKFLAQRDNDLKLMKR